MCGLYREKDIEYANLVKPEFIGFVFYPKSHRYVDIEMAKMLKSLLDPEIKAVGVFVDEDIEFIAKLVRENIIDMVQLHGKEDVSYILSLKAFPEMSGVPIIKAIVVKDSDFLEGYENALDEVVDFYLLDSGKGSGSSFNWNHIPKLGKPIFLAGGLDACNVTTAVKTVNPYAVDVSSGIETDKVKDLEKMKTFASSVRCG